MRRKILRSYQSIIILKPDLDGPQLDQAIEKIEQIFKNAGGSVINLERWGKKRLAYKVKKNKFGLYLNIYHTCEAAKTSAMEKEYQLFDLIIKYLVIKLDDNDVERIKREMETAVADTKANISAIDDDKSVAKEEKTEVKAEAEVKTEEKTEAETEVKTEEVEG